MRWPRLLQRNSDRWVAVLFAAGLPGIVCIANGVGVIETVVTAGLIGGVIAVVH